MIIHFVYCGNRKRCCNRCGDLMQAWILSPFAPFGMTTIVFFKILSKWLNSSIWPIDETVTGTITLGHSGPGRNGNEKVVHIPQSSWTEASSCDAV